ncbi:flagellar biosynthesis protein FlgP [Ferrimonas sediminicola]|uniref:Flagellar biosynthesis protein FlgP n=1 Tax=Ferrimonas sediminicola TaxID=2569538 RepID=A0A4U1BB80_9GAMM|nr:LPP20 family lipoprotein [Ferrimonas sediminicola]TKB47270.1 flagellar biosynthesis protein FlgP [Ferrimonas sediminicola]
MKRFAAAALLFLVGCQNSAFVEYESVPPEDFPILTAKGIAPISAQLGENRELKVQQAMRAAKLDAYRELAEQIYGVRVSGTGRMDQQLLQSDRFQTQVDGLVRGAEVVRLYPVGDNYVAELKLDYRKVWLLYQQVPRQRIKNVIYY